MSTNLNEKLYKRFGLQLERDEVVNGFYSFLINKAWEATYPLRYADSYKDSYPKKLSEARHALLEECCRELFLDSSDYEYRSFDSDHKYMANFLYKIFESPDLFEKVLINTQIFINVFYKQKVVEEELEEFIDEIDRYMQDFPVLGVLVKSYKTKAPQILPATSKHFDKEIIDTLGVLDTQQFKSVLDDFEAGLKLFAKAKTDSQFKDIIEDMHASCDEVVKIVLNDKNKSLKHAKDKNDHKKLGLNGHQKEIFKNLKNWMDGIKHGSKKNIDRVEVEMIISMTASFIRYVAVKSQTKI
ncbi:hypothetical protein KAS41_03340 [Candidatus Parcubacteria bacterium]|nr:hypothetical protein [Candidatus Parcubacteria bacterium]